MSSRNNPDYLERVANSEYINNVLNRGWANFHGDTEHYLFYTLEEFGSKSEVGAYLLATHEGELITGDMEALFSELKGVTDVEKHEVDGFEKLRMICTRTGLKEICKMLPKLNALFASAE